MAVPTNQVRRRETRFGLHVIERKLENLLHFNNVVERLICHHDVKRALQIIAVQIGFQRLNVILHAFPLRDLHHLVEQIPRQVSPNDPKILQTFFRAGTLPAQFLHGRRRNQC